MINKMLPPGWLEKALKRALNKRSMAKEHKKHFQAMVAAIKLDPSFNIKTNKSDDIIIKETEKHRL